MTSMGVTDIIAMLGAFVAVIGVVVSALTAKHSATKAELEGLRNTIKTLQDTILVLQNENERLRRRLSEVEAVADVKDKTIDKLEDEIRELRAQMNRRNTRPRQ